MGSALCHDDRYKIIQQNYGSQFKLYLIRQKNKAFLIREIGKVKKNVGVAAEKAEKMYCDEIAQGENEVDGYYLKIRKELNKRQPGGIVALQQMSKKNIDDTMGYNFLKSLFAEFKKQVAQAIRQEQLEIINELTEILVESEGEYIEEHKNLALINSISEQERQVIVKRGEMEFQNQILKTQEYLLERYSEQMNMQYLECRLTNINFRPQLLNLVSLSKDKLLTTLNLVLSEPIATYILIK